MRSGPQTYDVVALLEEVPTKHFTSGEALTLQRGQVGTVVEIYADSACEVEFADPEGRTYALLPITADKLIILHHTPQQVAA